MENIFSPQLDIPVSELEKIFFNAYSKETSGDPIGRSEMNKEYGIRDRWQCARASYLSESLIENLRTVSQKVIIKKPSEELLDTLLRNSHKVKRLKHYYNILPDGRVLDFTHKQLAYRGDIVFGEKISELSLEETFSISEKQGGVFIEKYEILKSNVIEGISCLFACPPQDIVEYLKTKKFKLLV